MKGDTILRQQKRQLDKGMRDVMPDSWEGHGRFAIRDSDVIPADVEETAIEKMSSLADKRGVSPERAANDLIAAIEKRKE